MKKIILLLCAVVMLLCSSCGFFGDKRYFCDIEEVESIQIIRLDRYIKEEYRYEHTVLSQISDCETFVNKLNNLKNRRYWGTPYVFSVQNVVIWIEYRNGNADMVYKNVQYFYRSEKVYSGCHFFDYEQFDALISEYLEQ